MPLKLWLPLDGTSENRGISGVTMSGSPASWGNGRTGKCAVFSGVATNNIVNTTKEFDYIVEDFSWAIWAKKDYSSKSSDIGSMWIFTVGRADAGGRGYGLRALSTTQVQVFFGSSTWAINCADNEWHHFAFTRKGTAIKIYRDGALVTSATFGGTLPTYSDGGGPGVGCFHYSGNIYPLVGAISDFRIYNHTLSAKEVYEISRGLILHYPLSAPGNANPNLLTWTKNYTEASPFVWTSARADGSCYMGNDTLVTVTPGKDYYIQLKSTAIPGTHATGGTAVTNNFTLFLYRRNQGTTKAVGSYDGFTNLDTNNIFINDPDRQLYVWKWTAPSNAQDITLRTNSYSDGTTAVTLKFWDFKIEEGTYTSYVPSKNSAQYAELGYGSGIVRDATGRGNDLVYSGTGYTHVSGSPRYSTALNFNQAAYLYNNSVPYTLTQLSISYWFKPISNNNAEHFLLGLFDSWKNNGLGIYHRANTAVYVLRLKSDAVSDTYIEHTFSLNVWHHVVITYDGTAIKYYVDNSLEHNVSYGSNGACSIKNVYLGNSMYNSTPTSEIEDSSMSDFRLYGTALSADDVAYLYKTSAAIDNSGDMFAESFEETELKPRVGSEGLVYGSYLTESGGTSCVTLLNSTNPFDPNRTKWSYTPAADADNSCMDFATVNIIEGVSTYHISMIVEWIGFADITTTNPNFGTNFHGVLRAKDGTTSWNTNPATTALNGVSNWNNMVKGAASGIYKYEATITLSNTFMTTYRAFDVGFRTNYSNGTGKITASKLRIYPADEHMTNSASLCSSGAIQVRLADEVHLA